MTAREALAVLAYLAVIALTIGYLLHLSGAIA